MDRSDVAKRASAPGLARRDPWRARTVVAIACVVTAFAACSRDEQAAPGARAATGPRKVRPIDATTVPEATSDGAAGADDRSSREWVHGRLRTLPEWGDDYRRRIDPAADGWPTEVDAIEIETSLARALESALAPGGSDAPIASQCASTFEGLTELAPAERDKVFDDGTIRVERASKIDPKLFPREELGELVRAWRAELGSAHAVRAVVRARHVREASDGRIEAELEIRVTAREGDRVDQHNARWTTAWVRAQPTDGSPRPAAQLASVRVYAFEVVRCARPVFAELTEAVLGQTPRYAEQILRGNDDYHLRSDRSTGQTQLYLGMHGIAIGDVNGDGLEDVYVPQPGGQPNQLLLHQPDGTVRDAAAEAGVDFLDNSSGALLVDLDSDGHVDLAVATAQHLVIGWNDGNGRFLAGKVLSAPDTPEIFSLSAADPDGDGDLDIYACRYVEGGVTGGAPRPYHNAKNGASNLYWRNEGGRKFKDATAESGLGANNSSFSLASIWEDYDDDGDVDLFVINDFGRKVLYQNDAGHFTDVTDRAGTRDQAAGMGVDCADVDLDGDDDVYVTNMDSPAGTRVAEQSRFMPEHRELAPDYVYHARGNTLLLARGDGTFEDATERAGVADAGWAWGSKFLDLNNDRYADIYVPNGFTTGRGEHTGAIDLDSFFWRVVVAQSPPTSDTTPEDYLNAWDTIRHLTLYEGYSWNGHERNFLHLNLGGVRFADASSALGVDYDDDGRAAATVDWDDDGRTDLWLRSRTGPRLRFLHNTHPTAGHFVALELVGTKCNREAIGASVRVRAGDATARATVHAGQGFLCASSRRLSFGLGPAERVDEITVRWPDGSRASFADLAADRRYRIVQGAERAEPIELRAPGELASLPTRAIESAPRPATRIVLFDRLPLAPIDVPGADGTTRKLSAFAGSPVLMSFWSAGHEASRASMRAIAEEKAAFAELGVQLVAMSTSDRAALAEDFAALKSWGWRGGAGVVDKRLAQVIEIALIEVLGPFDRVPRPIHALFDAAGQLTVVYCGDAGVREMLADASRVRTLDPHSRGTEELLQGRWISRPRRNFDELGEIVGMLGFPELAQYYKSEVRAHAGR